MMADRQALTQQHPVLIGLHIPKDVASALEMIGSATSGVAVFTVGLTLGAHAFHLSKPVLLGTLGRITIQTAVLLALLQLSPARPVRP